MSLKPITVNISEYPEQLCHYLSGAKLYDSSCSPNAKVIFIDRDHGYFLKIGDIGDLDREYQLTRYFYSKGLATRVVHYCFDMGHDYLLTEKIQGDDCTALKYLEQPERLAETLGERLALLHSVDYSDFNTVAECPANHTELYLNRAEINYLHQHYDLSLFPDNWGYASPQEAYAVIEANKHRLQVNTLLHGDYCLPNVILNDWRFSGFIDLDGGGIGDRHVDLFWGAWTLNFNLKTDKYRRRFFDAYGRDIIDEEMLRLVAACEVFG
ncbi:MAG: aminoglycoside 3'-phosphotransferase [Clostridium sp.]|jgi:kanamycin kinase|nr:aminoglycoside 3'-phosphotransferase [Clostridium sp.]